ncbi:MAG: trimethylamine methyltransferase family protein, partial [Anaerolineae bacterium]|nr:trimethylamine methyltransferase family protein [Anaerolineae bacterium]
MNWLTPELPQMLDATQVAQMHQGAVDVLADVGLYVQDDSVVRRLSEYPGVRVHGNRVHFADWLVEEYAEQHRAARLAAGAAPSRDRIHLSAGCCASHLADVATGEIRAITTQDLIDATQLIDALHDSDISGHVPGFPQDIPAAMQALAEYKIGSQYSRWGGGFTAACSLEALEVIYEMHQVMEQPFRLPLYVMNPLKIAGDSLETILHFVDRADGFGSSSMPIMGGTAPIHFIGAFVQSIAESIGGYIILRMLAPEKPASFSVMAFCLDMKYASITYGSPEQNLCDLIKIPV